MITENFPKTLTQNKGTNTDTEKKEKKNATETTNPRFEISQQCFKITEQVKMTPHLDWFICLVSADNS